MASNSLGNIFRLTTFGESHGVAIGGVLDGCPAGLTIDFEFIQKCMDRRRPGQSDLTTPRKESDKPEFLSGIFEGKTTGAPIAWILRNEDTRSKDYDNLKDTFRPSHADFTYQTKYGHRDYRGGGRASARETANWVLAGSIAQQLLKEHSVSIKAWVSRVKDISLQVPAHKLDLSLIEQSAVRCPDPQTAAKMEKLIAQMREEGDSVGGVISAVIKNVPPGWGDPVFEKLHANLGKAMLSINAVKGFEIGSGFGGTYLTGSQHNDLFETFGGAVSTSTNHSGGIQGGISNGNEITFNVAFKPTATIAKPQSTVDASGNEITLEAKGRHDPCVLPRAVPIVEAMAALVLADACLMAKLND